MLVSAFIAAGPPSRVLEATIDGRFELVLQEPVIDELRRILIAKLGFDPGRWQEVETFLLGLASESVSPPTEPVESATGDPDDDLILACAVEAEVEVLVSGDHKHLLPLEAYRGVRILTPKVLLAEHGRTSDG